MLFTKTDNTKLRNSEKLDYLSPAKVYDLPSLEGDAQFGDNSEVMIPGGRRSMMGNPLELADMN